MTKRLLTSPATFPFWNALAGGEVSTTPQEDIDRYLQRMFDLCTDPGTPISRKPNRIRPARRKVLRKVTRPKRKRSPVSR